jgi:hypothetical protein
VASRAMREPAVPSAVLYGDNKPPDNVPTAIGWHQNREAEVYLLTSKRRGARVDGMVSTCELSINVVKVNKLKRLTSLSQKAP